ncbi:MAG: tyrosine-type recombinase/integrase [Caldilineaceae bacterium]|nr:tyrosine-type recombinase/integrase [Caldilineaceae bacterium]MCB0105763.1 tyrosine-type recombinase/integrase [Caldilineaceae bacterium]
MRWGSWCNDGTKLKRDELHSEEAVLWGRGKRNNVRTVPLALGLAGTIDDWLHERGCSAGPLFTRILKSGEVKPNGLSTVAIYHIVEKRSQRAYVKPFTPHDMRRTFAGTLLDAGADIVTVQKLMGHASANTTAGYDRRGERVKRSAIDRLHMPWKRRFEEE